MLDEQRDVGLMEMGGFASSVVCRCGQVLEWIAQDGKSFAMAVLVVSEMGPICEKNPRSEK